MAAARAKIICPVRNGRGSATGASGVFLTPIPPWSLAVGVPAVVKKTAINIRDYRSEDQAAEAA
jgi:serine acetyltransferase